MATVKAISGVDGKSAACFLLDTGHARLLFDLGHDARGGLKDSLPALGTIDAIVLSHGHGDHAGGLVNAAAIGAPPVYATAGVIEKLGTALETRAIPVHGACVVCGVTLRTGRNGHAPGGVWLHADIEGGLLYTGDYSVESPVYAYDEPPQAATVILDASYGAYERSLEDCIAELQPLLASDAALLPVPPDGRGPEIAYHLARSDAVPHLGRDLRAALHDMARAPDRYGLRDGVAEVLGRLARTAPDIDGCRGAMLAGSATSAQGEAARLMGEWQDAAEPHIVITGYAPPGTPHRKLTESGRARFVRWNAHPRLSDNVALVRSTGARTVLPAFGGERHYDAWAEAFAPARVVINETIALQ